MAAVRAQMAPVRPLVPVADAHVHLQRVLGAEALVALGAGEGLLLQVHGRDVALQQAAALEGLAAVRAGLRRHP